jgi:hypothetical protein
MSIGELLEEYIAVFKQSRDDLTVLVFFDKTQKYS